MEDTQPHAALSCPTTAPGKPTPPFTPTKKKHTWIQINEKHIIKREIIKFANLVFCFSSKVLKTHLNFLHAWFGNSILENDCHGTVLAEFPTVIASNLTHSLPLTRHAPISRNVLYFVSYPFLPIGPTDVWVRCFWVVWAVL